MRGCVTIAANDGRSGQCESLLGANDMDNALSFISKPKIGQIKSLDVLFKGKTLRS